MQSEESSNRSLPEHLLALEPAPIPRDWIIEGDPQARCRIVSGSTDDRAFTAIWDCSAGRFEWHYDADETICLLEGGIEVRDGADRSHSLRAGDTFYFAAGTRYRWHVPVYVRKVAFIHAPLPAPLRRAQRMMRTLRRLFSGSRNDPRGALMPDATAAES